MLFRSSPERTGQCAVPDFTYLERFPTFADAMDGHRAHERAHLAIDAAFVADSVFHLIVAGPESDAQVVGRSDADLTFVEGCAQLSC